MTDPLEPITVGDTIEVSERDTPMTVDERTETDLDNIELTLSNQHGTYTLTSYPDNSLTLRRERNNELIRGGVTIDRLEAEA